MKDERTTTALAVIESPAEMIAAMRGELVPTVEDPEEVARAIVQRILDSETADQVLGGSTALHAQDVVGRPFELLSLRLLKSRFEGVGPKVFAVLDARFLDDGAVNVVTCSSRNVMAQAVMLAKLEALPRPVKIARSEQPTAAGFYPLWLESV